MSGAGGSITDPDPADPDPTDPDPADPDPAAPASSKTAPCIGRKPFALYSPQKDSVAVRGNSISVNAAYITQIVVVQISIMLWDDAGGLKGVHLFTRH